jgi:hypothetical protein
MLPDCIFCLSPRGLAFWESRAALSELVSIGSGEASESGALVVTRGIGLAEDWVE